MVYRLTLMRRRTQLAFILIILIFSAVCAIFGAVFIVSATILPRTRYNIVYNPLLDEIRQDMGPWVAFNYVDHETGDIYENVSLVRIEGRLFANTLAGTRIPDFRMEWIEEHHSEGIVFYIPDAEVLVYLIFNTGITYEVSVKPDHIWIDIQARSIKLNYDPSKEFIIIKRTPDTFGSSTKGEEQGTVFIVRDLNLTEWFERILHELSDNFVYDFIFIARNILIIVAIGGGAGIFTAFILVLTRLTRLFGGKHWTYFLLKRLNGKLGRLISFMPIFDFDGEFYVEERFVNIIDFSSIRTSLIELYKQRWYDILIFPTALASILTILFVQNYPGEDKIQALAFSPLFSPIVLILLLVYFPAIWAYNEGGFKRIKISPQGDIVAVKPLGKIMRDGLGIIIGFSGILSLGALAAQVTRSFTPIPTTTGQIQVAGFPIDLFGLLLLLLWTFGLFFLLLGSVIVGASLLAINNLLTTHLGTIEFLRRKSAEDGVINNWGSVSSQFAPVAKETLFSIEKPKKNK